MQRSVMQCNADYVLLFSVLGANGQLSRMIILILVPIITLVVIASIALQTTTEQNNEANELSSSIKYSIEIGKLVYRYVSNSSTSM